MSATLIDGKQLAEHIRKEVRKEIVTKDINPGLAIILVGDDPASHKFVSLKEKACHEVGIEFHKYFMDEDTTQDQLHETIHFLNADPNVTGIVLQLPLPDHLDENAAIAQISKQKDADGFGPHNLADFMEMKAKIIPALPNGIYELIKSTGEAMEGKKALIIANSEIFAKPIINMMEYKGAQASYIHPDDQDLLKQTTNADIIIIAVGRTHFLTKDMVKKGAILIDVGTNYEDARVQGDIDPAVDDIAGYRSPVPGGVGPMTIAMLLQNVLELHKLQSDETVDSNQK